MSNPYAEDVRDMVWDAGSKGVTSREIRRRYAGRLSQQECNDIIHTLCAAGDIFFVDNANVSKPGPKRQAYVSSRQHRRVSFFTEQKANTGRRSVCPPASVRRWVYDR